MGHTPGPWMCDRRDWLGRPAQDLYISGDEYSNDAGELCRVGLAIVTSPETGCETAMANARLITAAPDMLDVLERIITRATAPMSDGGIDYGDVAAARAAIAKARGENV